MQTMRLTREHMDRARDILRELCGRDVRVEAHGDLIGSNDAGLLWIDRGRCSLSTYKDPRTDMCIYCAGFAADDADEEFITLDAAVRCIAKWINETTGSYFVQ